MSLECMIDGLRTIVEEGDYAVLEDGRIARVIALYPGEDYPIEVDQSGIALRYSPDEIREIRLESEVIL